MLAFFLIMLNFFNMFTQAAEFCGLFDIVARGLPGT